MLKAPIVFELNQTRDEPLPGPSLGSTSKAI